MRHPRMSSSAGVLQRQAKEAAAAARQHGVVLYDRSNQCSSFSMLIHAKHRDLKYFYHWKTVESALGEHGIDCSWYSGKRTLIVSTTPSTKDPDMIYKAKRLLELVTTTNVSARMAIDVMNGYRQLCVIKIGNQEGGICANFGIKEEDFFQKWKCLFFSLQALTQLTLCNIFLNEYTVAAVGNSPVGIRLFRTVVETSIVENQCPATIIKRISMNLQRFLVMDDLEDPHLKHEEKMELSPFLIEHGASCYCVRFHECQKNNLQEAWPVVESSLGDCGISSTLNLVEGLVTVSTTGTTEDFELIDRTLDLVEALSAGVPASMAVKMLDELEERVIIKIGYQNGGLSSKFGIRKEQFSRQQKHLQRSLEDLATLLQSQLFLHGDSVFALGSSEKLDLVRKIVKRCIVDNANPVGFVKKLKKDRLNHKIDQLNRNILYRLKLDE